MTPWRARLARLMLGGLGLMWIGCGGGDVPDPDSDAQAATNEPPPAAAPVAAAPAPKAPEAPGEQAPTEAAAPAPFVVAQGPAGSTPAPGATPTAATPTPAPSSSSPSDSTTAEMLNLASNAPVSTPAAAEGGAAPGAAPGYPGGGAVPPGAGPAGMIPPPGAPPVAPPGTGSAFGPGAMMQPGGPGGPGGSAGYGPGGFGAPGQNGPADFSTPIGAVNAFLAAVRSKDREKVQQATARRAHQEAASKSMKDLFESIDDQSVSDEMLDELAKAFEGYSVMHLQQATKTAQRGVAVGKRDGMGFINRTVQVRREKDGWRVMDWTGYREFKSSNTSLRRPRTR